MSSNTLIASLEVPQTGGTRKCKILFYSGHCEIVGGDAKYLFDLINSIDDRRFDVVLYTDRNKVFEERQRSLLRKSMGISYLNTYPRLFHPGFMKTHFGGLSTLQVGRKSLLDVLAYLYKWVSFEWILGMTRNFFLFMKMFLMHRDTDIFHFNNGGYPGKEAGIVALLVAKLFSIQKVIMTVHNVPGPKSRIRPVGKIFDWIVRNSCTNVIAASENIRQDLIRVRGLPEQLISTIYCGIEDAELIEESSKAEIIRRFHLPEKSFKIGICGQYDEDRKGHLVLLEAIKILATKHRDVALIVVGSGREDRLRLLNDYAKNAGIEHQLYFLGYQTTIHEITSVFDIAVVPSTSNEATPYTIKEAARAGVPVITTTAGGCAAAVEHGKTGLVVEANNPVQLAEAIECLRENESLRLRMGEDARILFKSRFLLTDRIAEHLYIYYEQLREA